jgi:hypothetical protein
MTTNTPSQIRPTIAILKTFKYSIGREFLLGAVLAASLTGALGALVLNLWHLDYIDPFWSPIDNSTLLAYLLRDFTLQFLSGLISVICAYPFVRRVLRSTRPELSLVKVPALRIARIATVFALLYAILLEVSDAIELFSRVTGFNALVFVVTPFLILVGLTKWLRGIPSLAYAAAGSTQPFRDARATVRGRGLAMFGRALLTSIVLGVLLSPIYLLSFYVIPIGSAVPLAAGAVGNVFLIGVLGAVVRVDLTDAFLHKKTQINK